LTRFPIDARPGEPVKGSTMSQSDNIAKTADARIRYWIDKLEIPGESNRGWLESVQNYLCAEHGYTADRFGKMTLGEVVATLKRLSIDQGASRANDIEPLTPTQQAVYDLIPVAPDAITGKQISSQCSLQVDPGTLTTHIIPALRERRGIQNRRGAGYYRPST
jgi:hypothetical protein